MPAGSGSHPSSASSGAVEAECQHEAEADDFDGYADEDGIDDIDDIDDIFFKPWWLARGWACATGRPPRGDEMMKAWAR